MGRVPPFSCAVARRTGMSFQSDISVFGETSGGRVMASFFDMNRKEGTTMNPQERLLSDNDAAIWAAEGIYHAWDEALGRKDLDASLSLYAEDATLESPLIRHLLGTDAGVISGRANLRGFVERVFHRNPPLRQRHRSGFFTDGATLMWEYPRITAQGEQLDLVEIMELKDGLIQHHRVYWGWLGVKVLQEDRYRRD